MKNKKTFYPSIIAILVCILIVGLGLVYLVYGSPGTTTIGENISTTNLTVSGNASTTGTLDVTGNFRVNTNKFIVTAASGNTAIAGTLTVTSNATTSGNFVVEGSTTLATTTIGTNFFIDSSGNASTTGTFRAASSTLGTNFYIDNNGNASTSGDFIVGGTTVLATTTVNNLNINAGYGLTTPYASSTRLFATDATTTNLTVISTLKSGSTGQFIIDSSGNASTTGGVIFSGLVSLASTTINNTLAVTGTTTFGGGDAISKHISKTISIDVQNVATSTCVSTSTTAITGVAVGDTVIATPEPCTGGIETLTLSWNAYASTTNEVALRVCNVGAVNDGNPAVQTWRFDIWKH